MTISQRAAEEVERLKGLLTDAGIAERKINALLPVIENTAWIKVKLDDAREYIRSASVVISYDNGGGQTGLRENPALRAYESLWKSYMAGMNRILDVFPAERIAQEADPSGEESPKTVLQLVRAKHTA